MNINIKDKKTLVLVISVCMAFVLVFAGIISAVIVVCVRQDDEADISDDLHMMGTWIASVSNIDFPSAPDLSRYELCREIDDIVDTVEAAGLDTVFFQVRPSADALYESQIFPVSRYMSSTGELTLDALDYMITAAHEKGIRVHAWINPLRVATSGSVDDLFGNSPARQHSEWTVKYDDGKIYFNCGIPEVIQLICDGVLEILDNYDVDGIVFDDYFYPYPTYITAESGEKVLAEFADAAAFETYGGDFDNIGDWRRDNVNRLIHSVYDTVKKKNPDCVFGVAPFGIWKNGYGDEGGSETRGSQSYYDIYCDTLAWVEGGYVDYIAPQLYWRDIDLAAPYNVLCDWWAQRLSGSSVKLLVSHAAYRYEEDWQNPEGIMRYQVEYAAAYEEYYGSIFYGYEEIKNNTYGITDEIVEMCTSADEVKE